MKLDKARLCTSSVLISIFFLALPANADEASEASQSQLNQNFASHLELGSSSALNPNTDAANSIRLNALGVSYGRFGSGFWAPVQPAEGLSDFKYDSCNAFFFCSEDGLFGSIVSVEYIRRILYSKRHSIDLDIHSAFGRQSPVIKEHFSGSKYIEDYRNGPSQIFNIFSLIPTYRYKISDWLSIGVGGGISYSFGGIPADTQGNNFMTRGKVELAFRPLSDDTVESVFSFEHSCSFFGFLDDEGVSTGSNWYSIGLRKWF